MQGNYIQIVTIVDKLNELNEKLNQMIGSKLDSVLVGSIILGLILLITFWGIGELNKK